MAGITDSIANVTLLAAKAVELVASPEGRLLLGIALAKAGYTADKLDQHTRMLRMPPPPPTQKKE